MAQQFPDHTITVNEYDLPLVAHALFLRLVANQEQLRILRQRLEENPHLTTLEEAIEQQKTLIAHLADLHQLFS